MNYLIMLIVIALAPVTALSQATSPTVRADQLNEEQVIKTAYEKLMRYHKATVLYETDKDAEEVPPSEFLSFELKNFHSGPLSELEKIRFDEIVPDEGYDIEVVTGEHSENGGPYIAIYRAEWAKQKTPKRSAGLDLIMADIFRMVPREFFDISRYTSYEVTVSFKNRTRTYKSYVYLHNLHDSSAEPWFQFADPVVDAVGHAHKNDCPPASGKNPRFKSIGTRP